MKLLTNICVNSLTPGLLTLSVSDFGLHWVRLSDYDFLHGMWGPFNQHGWHLILAWIINHRVSKMWVKFGMPWVTWISNLPLLYYGCDRLSMLIFFKFLYILVKVGPRRRPLNKPMFEPMFMYDMYVMDWLFSVPMPLVSILGSPRERRSLKKGAVPSIFNWTPKSKPADEQRSDRAHGRASRRCLQPKFEEGIDVAEVTVQSTEEDVDIDVAEVPASSNNSRQTPHWNRLDINDLMMKPKLLQYYTGLNCTEHFHYVLDTLGPAAYHLNYRWRTPQTLNVTNQFLLTLIKLRLHTPNIELGFLFNISEFSVSNIVVTWINFMSIQWSNMNMWPTRDIVHFYMPEEFKENYPHTRVIIDGIEAPIKKPGKPVAQQVTYSSYKNRNTLKCVDRKIASLRVHVERVIGLAKTYKILTTPMTEVETKLGSEIFKVVFMLCNLRNCIVKKSHGK